MRRLMWVELIQYNRYHKIKQQVIIIVYKNTCRPVLNVILYSMSHAILICTCTTMNILKANVYIQ